MQNLILDYYFFQTKYDLVTSAFTLLDLTSQRERIVHIESLWRRVQPGGYLILTEVGTPAGFHAISEARNVLKALFAYDEENDGEILNCFYTTNQLKMLRKCPEMQRGCF